MRLDNLLRANPVMPTVRNPVLPTEHFSRHWDQEKYDNVRDKIHQYRERSERIEAEADELVRLLGDDAYSEARWREHTASSSASAQEWNLIALAIARQTGRRIGVDLSTRMAMNAVFAPDREPDDLIRKLRH